MSTFEAMASDTRFGNLPKADRLRLLAEVLRSEIDSGRWNQRYFSGMLSDTDIEQNWEDLAGKGSGVVACSTTLCTAGWAVTIMPPDEIDSLDGWESAAARGLGLADDVAEMLFYWIPDSLAFPGAVEMGYRLIPRYLEILAELPDGERTLENSLRLCGPEMVAEMERSGASVAEQPS